MTTQRLKLSRIALAIGAVLFAGFSASAQETKITKKAVPTAVINAFKSKYPNATIVGYAREKENGKTFYEIESKEGDLGRDVLYNPDGTVVEIEETVKVTDLPSRSLQIIQSKYTGDIVKAEKITQGEKVRYEIILRQGKRRLVLGFDADGKLENKVK